MAMCYLCDLCACWDYAPLHRHGIDLLPCETGGQPRKFAIDYGKQDPMEICRHFVRKEEV